MTRVRAVELLGSGIFFSTLLCLISMSACVDTPEFALAIEDDTSATRASDGGIDSAADVEAGTPRTPTTPPSSSNPPANDAGVTPPPQQPPPPKEDPPPPPKAACPGIGVCCGTVACIDCSKPESGDCRECEKACHPGEVCCKKGGPPRCRALNAKGKGKGNGKGDDDKDDDDC